MIHIFNGKVFAKSKEKSLQKRCAGLHKKGVTPKLVSFLIEGDEDSELYSILKQEASKRVGIEMDIVKLVSDTSTKVLVEKIIKAGKDDSIHGVMVQLPLPDTFSESDVKKVINSIEGAKDVDGMRDDSNFTAPVAKAALFVLKEAEEKVGKKSKVVVLGSHGFVGKKLVNALKDNKYDVSGLDINDDLKKAVAFSVLISVIGKPSLITSEFVKEGAVVIDVGAPEGDVDTLDVSQKVSFLSPVPAGVGPVTITSLLENVIESAEKLN